MAQLCEKRQHSAQQDIAKEEPVSFLRKWFGREEPEDVPITLDVERRKEQLLRLERALDSLAAEMRADHTTNDPAWRERINEYSRLAGDAMGLRRGTPTREKHEPESQPASAAKCSSQKTARR